MARKENPTYWERQFRLHDTVDETPPHNCPWCGRIMKLGRLGDTFYLYCTSGAHQNEERRCPVHPITREYVTVGMCIRSWNRPFAGTGGAR